MTAERSRRSYSPVTTADLERLAVLGCAHHDTFQRAHPAWADTLLVMCLAQGAAAHLVDGVKGVKDFDVWLFYELPAGRSGAYFPWNRHVAHVDFGPSVHGRPLHTEDERANPTYDVAGWERFDGRRVDLMARAIARHRDGPEAALAAWLDRGARRRPNPDGSAPSPWWLAQAPVVDLRDGRHGNILWHPNNSRR